MKTTGRWLLLLLLAGCEQSSQPATQVFSDAEYSGNVSSLYSIGALGNGASPTDFSWHDSTGAIHSLTEYKGRNVLLNFWASWCGPCKEEIPALENIALDSSAVTAVIGVSVDLSGNTFQTVHDFVVGAKMGYQVVLDSSESLFVDYIAAANGTDGIPETFVIGRDGTIKFLLIGEQSEQAFRTYISKAN